MSLFLNWLGIFFTAAIFYANCGWQAVFIFAGWFLFNFVCTILDAIEKKWLP